jgi:REP element-mobilizing transposase RayT
MNAREQIWGVEAPKRRPRRVRRRPGGKPLKVRLPPKGSQLSFAHKKTWGGPRPGSGRKAGARPNVRHRTRPVHRGYCPVHVTFRRAKGLPSFRVELLHRLLRDAIRDTQREGFRIVEYSVQADHIHMIVEADDAALLSSGMRSFAIRVAMRVNSLLLRRRGRVWGDRHHRRELTSPSEVRSVLVYVLNNHLKHHEADVGLIDPFSSAPWFTGWMHQREPPPPDAPSTRPPSTWLLESGWSTLGGGWLFVGEAPRAVWRAA